MMARKYKGLIIASIIGVILAVTLLLVGGHMAGWDIKAWFDFETSKYLQWSVIAIITLALAWMSLTVPEYLNKHMRRK